MDIPATLDDARRFLEQRAYEHFRATAEWPRARDFDMDYHDLFDPLGGLEVVCRQIGHNRLGCGSPTSEHDRVTLRLPALADCEGAEEDLATFLAAVRLGAERYHTSRGREVLLSAAQLAQELGIEELAARRAIQLLLSADGLVQGGGRDAVTMAHLVSRMRGVSTLDDYFGRVAADEGRRTALAQQAAARAPRRAPGPARRVFLSHAADDATLAHYLADIIRQGSKATVFVASKAGDIPTGSDWLSAIEEELKRADTYLLLLTPFSVKRFWLWYESGAAWMSERPFVPVTAAGLAKADVPYPLGARQALALDDPADAAQLARDLGATIADVDRFCETVTGLCESLPWRMTRSSGDYPTGASTARRNAVIRALQGLDEEEQLVLRELVIQGSADAPELHRKLVTSSHPFPDVATVNHLMLRVSEKTGFLEIRQKHNGYAVHGIKEAFKDVLDQWVADPEAFK